MMEAISSKKQSEPYVLFGSYKEPQQAFIIADYQVLSEISIDDAPLALLCCFFVFNICYNTKGCSNVYCFLEHSLFCINHKQLPPSVSHFLASLHVHAVFYILLYNRIFLYSIEYS